ncbi:MMPL family transporter [Corallococcus exiguus]|uniref:efflux RND transporter permease subunit n=1 Tax=Corallococcus TaxID=83461 RepID=UPI000EA379BB|nr:MULTISPECIES: efflux RND transporter permease subunit [Corallococcus]NNC16243.1 MMPL family transporter [Corallococcus exiguus]NRD52625.1 efflux RND transporter permease subunit [Corallococcus exiguus]RKH29947.1 multidrug efflux protein [Corallococcus sp. CA041A]RKI17078.1 multidrug efflux protein [Corallococcus sp. AB030]RUO94331.1 multidrug efflux protein [Corallococcus sp. AB018]
MNFTDLFIRRPVVALVVNLIIIIAGLQALRSLNVRQYPRSENADITVTTVYVGANAELVRGFITTPLERVIAAADGIDYVESTSSQNVSIIRARLKLNYDANRALSEISAKVDQVRGDLPPESQVPVMGIESADSQFAVAYLNFTSDFLEQNELSDYLVRVVQPRLSSVEGVQRADILGARTFAMRVWMKPDQMAALNVSPIQVRQALATNNSLAAVGQTKGSLVQVNLTANTGLRSVEEFKQLIVRKDGGAVVRLSDVADVVLGAEDYDTDVTLNGKTAVFVGIWALPNANSLDVMQRIRLEMDSLKKDLPEQIHGGVAFDGTDYIQNAIDEVVSTLIETLIIVVIVIFLFLGSVRSILVPVVAIPVSLIGTVFLMQVFGFTVNLLTLLAVVLSVGLVVDDAIVVVENVERHLRDGLRPVDAAIKSARELVGPIIAMTLTLAAVYAPIAFQGGLTGSLFREFALTLAGAVTLSGVVALTLSPMMSSVLLKAGHEDKGLAGVINRGFERLRAAYSRSLDSSLLVRGPVYAAWIFLSVLALVMFNQSARELAPVEDQDFVIGIMSTPSNSTLDQLKPSVTKTSELLMDMPESSFNFQIVQPSNGFWGLVLKPYKERQRTTAQVLAEAQERVNTIPAVQTFTLQPPALPGGGNFPVEFVIASTAEAEELLGFAQQLQEKATQSGMFAFPPIIDVKLDQPQSELEVDREKVAQLGLNLGTVGQDLGTAVGGNFVNRFNIAGRSYKVIPQVLRSSRLTPEQLKDIHVTGPDGKLVALSAIASIQDKVAPRSLNRFQQLNAVKLSGVAIRPLDEALTYLETEASRILPAGYRMDYTGESRQLRTEGDSFAPAFGLAVVLIFLVLAAQFNSFRDPLIILAGSVPLALFGALITTFLRMPNPMMPYFTDSFTTTLNIYSQVGLVTLVGLIAKNGILIVDFANRLQEEGKSKLEAVKEAASERLRPILMTTVATVAGHFPLVLVSGPGAAARNSIGLVLVTGMALGTLFTLYFVPAIYLLIAKTRTVAASEAPELQQAPDAAT